MNNLDDVYGSKNRKPLWTLGGLAALVTAIAGLLPVLSQLGLLQPNPTPPPIVIVSSDSSARPAAPVPTTQPVAPPPVATSDALRGSLAEISGVSAETEQLVNDFLAGAVVAEILAYSYGDASYAAQFMTGDALQNVEKGITDLKAKGLYGVPTLDINRSRIVDIRGIDDQVIEVDTCEVWTVNYYRLLDDAFVGIDGPSWAPQTITIKRFTTGWFITNIVFYDPPSFC